VKHLVSSMKPTSPRNKLFANQQEAVRKAVERVFAVLFQRFNIIYQPSRIFDKGNMTNVMYTCCIIHNIVLGSRRERYTGTQNARVTDLQTHVGSHVSLITEPDNLRKSSLFWTAKLNEKEGPQLHEELKNALASSMWAQKGGSAETSFM
jgi:Plant transposon protein